MQLFTVAFFITVVLSGITETKSSLRNGEKQESDGLKDLSHITSSSAGISNTYASSYKKSALSSFTKKDIESSLPSTRCKRRESDRRLITKYIKSVLGYDADENTEGDESEDCESVPSGGTLDVVGGINEPLSELSQSSDFPSMSFSSAPVLASQSCWFFGLWCKVEEDESLFESDTQKNTIVVKLALG